MMNISSTKELISFLKEKLSRTYEAPEAENLAFIVAEDFLGLTRSDYIMDTSVAKIDISRIDSVLDRLRQNEPIQHIKGEVEFYGLSFNVSKDVLIPRPETEELVDIIIKENQLKGELNIIDYCTGSGCIAISLDKHLTGNTKAYDISEPALVIAEENNKRNQSSVLFHQANLLEDLVLAQNIDIIVSNPPYVMEKEKERMNKNVLDYDPHLALFVKDDNALVFYDRIAEFASKQLKPSGHLYFEINEQLGKETKQLVLSKGFQFAEVIKDFRGKDRFIKALR